ncbi:C-type lectin domain family 2 member D-like [Erinaceus europaeus]|uniref:C-type lectin domain family 2 member D-like n=1 Tax=Erinaceus europaeus TaxID=9365 RepID=A0ABM3XNG1_ERIEU|nr:C-type lectin domain family 2 member D-like [Erinaceus europaeus]
MEAPALNGSKTTSRNGRKKKESGDDFHRKNINKYTNPIAKIFGHLRRIVGFLLLAANICCIVCTVQHLASNNKRTVEYYDCPETWIGIGNKCFYFSDDTRNWTSSQDYCASYEANLVHIETEKEMNFLKCLKGPFDHWIGLRREFSNHTWKWTHDSKLSIWFEIKGTGECAFLSDRGVSSGRIYAERRWICIKSKRINRC